MSDCCSKKVPESTVQVNVNVDVPKIVKYSCITGVLIVAIVFGSKIYKKMLESGIFTISGK